MANKKSQQVTNEAEEKKKNDAKVKELQDIFKKNHYDLVDSALKSKTWFNQQVTLLRKQNITTNAVLNSGQRGLHQARILPGNLYMFVYDPKHKETLPYYDRFPLVFPFATVPGGFLGLNMHYLPYKLRMMILLRLMQFQTNARMDDNTKLKFSWGLISSISKFDVVKYCVKHYLTDHVRSHFRKIPADDWATAMLLPVEQFTKANKNQVWAHLI